MSRRSRPSTNDKGDDEMIPEAMHKSPSLYLMAEDNPEKTSARRPSDEGCVTSKGRQY